MLVGVQLDSMEKVYIVFREGDENLSIYGPVRACVSAEEIYSRGRGDVRICLENF
jgi:hypothetical protein